MRPDVRALRTWILRLAAAAALALVGCGGDDTKTVTVAPGAAGAGGGATQTTTSSAGASSAGGAAQPGEALAKKTVPALNSKDGTVEIAIRALKVEDRLMRLTMSFAPKFPSAAPDESINLFEMHGKSTMYVTLVDPVNLKRYVVVKDADRKALEPDQVFTAAVNGASVTGTWTFAAPPADVEKLDVQVGEFPPFSDVEVQR